MFSCVCSNLANGRRFPNDLPRSLSCVPPRVSLKLIAPVLLRGGDYCLISTAARFLSIRLSFSSDSAIRGTVVILVYR